MIVPRFDSALTDLLRKHQENPKDVGLTHQLCYAFNMRSYHDQCIEYARRGLSVEPHHTEIYNELIIASSLDVSNTLDSLLGELQAILEQRPKDLGTLTNLALVHYYLEQDDVAERIVSEILDEQRADRRTYETLALIEYARQNFEKCIDYCEKAIDQPGPSARMVRLKGLCYQELGEIEQALRSFTFCLELEPAFVWACHSLACLSMQNDDFVTAWQYFGKASFINPHDPGNLFLLAEAFMDMEQYDLAIAELQKLLLIGPSRHIEAEVQNALGYLYLQRGDLNHAEETLKAAIELEPEFALAYHNMGQVAQSRKNYAEAEACYRTALEFDPLLSEALVEMGFMQFQQKDYDTAMENFREAVEVDPYEAQAYLGLSKICQKRKKIADQMEHAMRAYELDPTHSEINNNLGIAFECVGDLEEAEEAYVRALELNDMNAAAANNLGHLYEKKMALSPDQSESYRESAIEAWSRRLHICRVENRSTKAAMEHLRNLGLSKADISSMSASE